MDLDSGTLNGAGSERSGMSETTAAAVGYDELAALKFVALDGGLAGPTKLSCAGLAERLDASTQTASRRLQRLEAAGLVERDVVADGQWVTVTGAGEASLRREYTDYRRLFDGETTVTLRGRVTGGMGEGRHYISLSGYMRQFRDRLGYEPFPGTLNVSLDADSVRRRAGVGSLTPVPIDGWEDDERTFGPAACYPARVTVPGAAGNDSGGNDSGGDVAGNAGGDADGGADDASTYDGAHIIVPERTHHDDSQLELIAPDRLRDVLSLADDDLVAVHVTDAERREGDA
jgi:riboflavin kinase